MAEHGDVVEQFAFALDGFFERDAFARQRMTAARFGKAGDEGVVARFEEEAAQVVGDFAQGIQHARQRGDALAGAHVDGHGGAAVAGVAQGGHQLRQQRGGQVVDDEVARVFEHLEGDTFARTGEAANQDELHGREEKWSTAAL